MKQLTALILVLAVTFGAGNRLVKRLEPDERVHYEALKVWMDDKQEKSFLKLKTRQERDGWLKAQGYWDFFYKYDPTIREQISKGNVRVGWTEDMVFMAWGPPHEKRKLGVREAIRSELFIYKIEVTEDNEVLIWAPGSKVSQDVVDRYRYELRVYDGKVVQMDKKSGWGGPG